MCAVSFVGDSYKRHFDNLPYQTQAQWVPSVVGPSAADIAGLKAKVEEMIAMLKAAKAYDVATGQADCQMDEKLELLRKIAALVGVDLDAVLEVASIQKNMPQVGGVQMGVAAL